MKEILNNDKKVEYNEKLNDQNNIFKISVDNTNTSDFIKIEKNTKFSIGIDIKNTKDKINKDIGNSGFGFIDNKLIRVIDDTLYYNGFEYIKIKKYYKKKKTDNTVIYRCKNYRKDKHLRKKEGRFCNAKIELLIDADNNINNQKFKVIHDHSSDCIQKEKIIPLNKVVILEWDD